MSPQTDLFARCPATVEVVEVGPRDGLQNTSRSVSTAEKIAFTEALVDAGCKHVEVSSFVSPKRVPQLADAEAVFNGLHRRRGVVYTALVPNERGLERALKAGVRSIAVLTAASETFNRRNLGCSTEESLERMRAVVEHPSARELRLRAYISTAFVCPYEGAVATAAVAELVRRIDDLGVHNISLGDTLGAAYPDVVSRLLDAVEARRPLDGIALHLHDTYRRALANVLVGLLHGVSEFDSSAGGLGGCPFAPGARGNVATEELVDFLHGLGVTTGIDVAKVRQAREQLPVGT